MDAFDSCLELLAGTGMPLEEALAELALRGSAPGSPFPAALLRPCAALRDAHAIARSRAPPLPDLAAELWARVFELAAATGGPAAACALPAVCRRFGAVLDPRRGPALRVWAAVPRGLKPKSSRDSLAPAMYHLADLLRAKRAHTSELFDRVAVCVTAATTQLVVAHGGARAAMAALEKWTNVDSPALHLLLRLAKMDAAAAAQMVDAGVLDVLASILRKTGASRPLELCQALLSKAPVPRHAALARAIGLHVERAGYYAVTWTIVRVANLLSREPGNAAQIAAESVDALLRVRIQAHDMRREITECLARAALHPSEWHATPALLDAFVEEWERFRRGDEGYEGCECYDFASIDDLKRALALHAAHEIQ
jgi:hypothetical protein